MKTQTFKRFRRFNSKKLAAAASRSEPLTDQEDAVVPPGRIGPMAAFDRHFSEGSGAYEPHRNLHRLYLVLNSSLQTEFIL